MRLNSSASAPSSSRLVLSIRMSRAPEPIFAAAAWIDSIGRTRRRTSNTPVALASSRNATSRIAVRQIADSSGANALLSGPRRRRASRAGDRLVRAQDLRPLWIAPDGRHVGVLPPAAKRRLHLRQRGEARATEEKVGVEVGDEQPLCVDRVRIPRGADSRPRDDLGNEAQVDVGDDDPAPWSAPATAIFMCGGDAF